MRGANGDGGPWGGLPEPYRWDDWTVGDLVRLKEAAGTRVSLVVPARDEAATIGDIVKRLRAELVERYRLLDQLIVIDSDSTDGTLVAARDAGALVYRASDIRPDLGSHPGKGEALWKSQFVASGDLLVFIDADLLDWDTHFVSGLLGPLLTDAATMLVKGFYQRPFLADGGPSEPSGGRVTELVARPLIALEFPELAGVVQPLAGEWATRRDHFASLSVPTGYGVELAALVDTAAAHGTRSIAQVDLGYRSHRHQGLLALGAMATEVLGAASRRSRPQADQRDDVDLVQFGGADPDRRVVSLVERPPAREAR